MDKPTEEQIARTAYQFSKMIDDKKIEAAWEQLPEVEKRKFSGFADWLEEAGYTRQPEPVLTRINDEAIDTLSVNQGDVREYVKAVAEAQLAHDQETLRGKHG